MKLFRNLKKEIFLFLVIGIVLAFFYRGLILGQIPFPGDLLVAHQEPYRSYSFLGFDKGGVPHKAQGPDVIKQLLPWKHFSIETIMKGQIPLWNPYSFSGTPHAANFQSGVFYPGNIIFLAFDFGTAWKFFIILSPILSAVFTYLFLRRLKLRQEAAAFGALSYTFSLYMVVWIEYGNIGHTLAWLPLVLYFADKLLEKIDYKFFLGLVVASTFSILAGYIQGLFYIYTAATFYYFYKGFLTKNLNFKKSLIFICGLVFPVALTLFQLLPTLELFVNSTRGNYSIQEIEKLLNPFWYLITVFAPDFFGNPASRNFWFDGTYIERVSYFGLIPLVFAFFAIKLKSASAEVKIFKIVFFLTIILSIDLVFTRFLYSIPLPVISTTVPTRILSLFGFAGSILAAYGFESMLSKKGRKDMSIICLSVLLFLFAVFVFVIVYPRLTGQGDMGHAFGVSMKNLILPITSLTLLILLLIFYYHPIRFFGKFKQGIVVLFIIVITSLDLFFYFNRITPFAPKEFLYPATPPISFLSQQKDFGRFWGYGSAGIESNIEGYEGIFSTEGNDPLHIKSYAELLSVSKEGKIEADLSRTDAKIAPGFGKFDITQNENREIILNLAGVKYVLNKDESINGDYNPDGVTFPNEKFKLVWQEGVWQVYQNLNVLPRTFITADYEVISDPNTAIERILDDDFDIKQKLILEKNPEIKIVENLAGRADISRYSPNEVVIIGESSYDSLLFLSDAYYPGWKAFVDGEEREVLRANYAYRAVSFPAGKHEVTMRYEPESFWGGLYASLISFIIFLGFIYFLKYRYEK